MLSWYAITSAVYYAAEADSLSADSLYFLTDTHEIYKGAVPFTESVVIYSGTEPTSPARRKIYINSATGEGKIYTGTEWQTVIKPIESTVTPDGTNPINSAAVIAYVTEQINNVTGGESIVKSVTYNPTGNKLVVTNGAGEPTEVVLSGLGVSLEYTSDTGELKLKDVTGAVLGSTINLDLERFVQSGSYDDEAKTITLVFNDSSSPVVIPVGDLVDTYTAADTDTVHLTVTSNQFTAEVIVAETAGNMLQATESGLYVAATDLSNYMQLVASASTTAIPMLNAQGQVINGTMTAGGAALAGTPNATTLATELAVNALVQSTKAELEASLAKKMALVSSPNTTNIPMLNAQGQIINGTKQVGGATLNSSPNADTLATEAAVNAAIQGVANNKLDKTSVVAINDSAQTGQAADAKSAYDALTWKTTL